MAAPVTTRTDWPWPAEVTAFANQHQVERCLEPMWQATRRIFPMAKWQKVYLDEDPEIAGDKHIIFDVKAPDLPLAQASEARDQWIRDLFSNCPTTKTTIFRLCLDLGFPQRN